MSDTKTLGGPQGTEPAPRRTSARIPIRKRVLFIMLIGWCSGAHSVDSESPWPARLYELPLENLPLSYAYEDTRIDVTADTVSGSGEATTARRVEFRVVDLRSGRDYAFAAETISAAIVVSKDLMPEIEIWSPAGAQRFARCVFRKVGRQYCCTQQDTFGVNAEGGSPGALTLPGTARSLQHLGSRANPCE